MECWAVYILHPQAIMVSWAQTARQHSCAVTSSFKPRDNICLFVLNFLNALVFSAADFSYCQFLAWHGLRTMRNLSVA